MMTAMQAPVRAEQLTIVPANEASWDDLVAIFGTTDYPGRFQCQRFKVAGWIWRDSTQGERTAMHRAQTACGDPNATAASGLGRGRAAAGVPQSADLPRPVERPGRGRRRDLGGDLFRGPEGLPGPRP